MISAQAEPDTAQLFRSFYSYYPEDPSGSSEQQVTYPPKLGQTNAADEGALRRVHDTQQSHSSFPPPSTRLPHASYSHASCDVNPSPALQSFCTPHYPTPSRAGGSSGVQHRPQTMDYGGHVPISVRRQQNHYRAASPIKMSAPSQTGDHGPPSPHSYHRLPEGPGRYVSSPGVRLVSPCPAIHLFVPGITASKGFRSSTSYSSRRKTAGQMPTNEHGVTSESYDDGQGEFTTYTMGWTGSEKEPDNQPWGMPQEEYRALNPREKKQVRNR